MKALLCESADGSGGGTGTEGGGAGTAKTGQMKIIKKISKFLTGKRKNQWMRILSFPQRKNGSASSRITNTIRSVA